MQTVSEINNYPEPKFWRHLASAINRFLTASQFRYFAIAARFRHFWRHLASAINSFLTASQFRYFSIATRFRHFWRHLASAIRRFLTASQFRYFSIATRFRRLSRHLAKPQTSPPQSNFSASIKLLRLNQARFL